MVPGRIGVPGLRIVPDLEALGPVNPSVFEDTIHSGIHIAADDRHAPSVTCCHALYPVVDIHCRAVHC
ncbi:unnamed protein product [Sphagnum troendelagicum]|uniref:Uncharacterized protein n=1 Tax=Sphagnum troendelagicum TaxID=128251 RepID=A0ABP0UHH5_9BRYO